MDTAVAAQGNGVQDGRGHVEEDTPQQGLEHGQPQDGDNKFQEAIAAWRNIDLTKLVPMLDLTASDIVTQQRDSLLQRKDLAQKTKDFRKLDDASKLVEVKGLLKAYQTFIDSITNHAKATSNAFLQVYSPLSEAPDPYPLLEASVDSLLVSEETVPKLTSENHQLQRTVKKLTAQLEDTEKRLEDERNLRKEVEGKREAQVKEVEVTWTAVLEEKEDNWAAKERSLEEKIENQERLVREMKASFEVSQRLGHAGGGGEEFGGGASAAELEIVSSDLERTTLRLAEVESRNEQLRMELAQSASSSHLRSSIKPEDDPAFLRLRSENSSLFRKLDALRLEKESSKRDWETRLRGVERDLASIKYEKDSLKAKLEKWYDYEDVKRELEMLRSIEFATGDDEEFDEGAMSPDSQQRSGLNGSAVKSGADSLEKLLLARNKKLNNELIILRVSHQDLQAQLNSLQEDLSNTNAELERSRNLTATLENDLLKVQREASNAFQSSAVSVAGTYTSRHPAATSFAGRRGRTSPTSSIISGFDPQGSSQATLEAIRAGEAVGGGSGILPMITAQRDRFKQKNQQLEDELSKSYNIVSSLRQEIAGLQKDNLNLYEKTRYVSSYNRGQPGTASSSSYSTNPNPSSIQVSSSTPSGLSLERYRSAYEANISPFAAFRGRESARAYKRMSLPERVVFSITRMILANRMSRNIFAIYCLALHLLVFGMLYWMGTVDIEKHSSKLGDMAAGAAAAAAGPIGDGLAGAGDKGSWHQEGFSGGG